MTIQRACPDVGEKKKELENRISDLLNSFSEDTGVPVHSIRLYRSWGIHMGKYILRKVNYCVNIDN